MTKRKPLEWVEVEDKPYNEEHFLLDLSIHNAMVANMLLKWGLDLPALRALPLKFCSSAQWCEEHQAVDSHLPENQLVVRTTSTAGYEILWGEWIDLLDIENMGPVRLLSLVNFIRDRGIELPWFVKFDELSENWVALKGRSRTPPCL
jgi:hypothetical protein